MTSIAVDRAETDALRAHLVANAIAGDVATPREDNLEKYDRLARRLPYALFGLRPTGRWNSADILSLMATCCGVSPDADYLHGPDRIDPERTLAGLHRMAEHIGSAARDRSRVILATGHPAGLLPVYLAVAGWLAAAGAQLLTPAAGWSYDVRPATERSRREIRYVGNVAMLSNRGDLNHTHSPRPMEAMLAELRDRGIAAPDLVVGDHGWVGAAGQAGIPAVGFADSNDPALFVGEAEGTVAAVVPLDDNVAPHLYDPLTHYLLRAAGARKG